MKKIFFYTVWDFTHSETDGICKKIISQINALKKLGYEVDYSFIQDGKTYVRSNEKTIKIANYNPVWNKLFANRKLAEYIKRNRYDGIYCRYACADWYFNKFLKNAKKGKNRIVVEIPSYPYDKEVEDTILGKVFLCIDKVHRNNLKKYVDRIATYSEDEIIFGIPTIKVVNGIDFSAMCIRKVVPQNDVINMIAVASMASWHGYDRIIEGLGRYYQEGGQRKIILHLVGDGREMANYKKMISSYQIQEHVILYGMKSGRDLDAIYNKCDIAVASLGLHRLGLYLASTLKTREYGAKGLPIITSSRIDAFPFEKCFFVYKVPEDDTVVDMAGVVDFYDGIYRDKDKEKVAINIREFAKGKCDILVTMKRIANFFEEEKGSSDIR